MSVYTHVPRSHQVAEFCGTRVVESVPTTPFAALFPPMAKARLTSQVAVEVAHAEAVVLNGVKNEGGRAVRYWPGYLCRSPEELRLRQKSTALPRIGS